MSRITAWTRKFPPNMSKTSGMLRLFFAAVMYSLQNFHQSWMHPGSQGTSLVPWIAAKGGWSVVTLAHLVSARAFERVGDVEVEVAQ